MQIRKLFNIIYIAGYLWRRLSPVSRMLLAQPFRALIGAVFYALILFGVLLLILILCGCGTGYRSTSKAALVSNFQPCIIVGRPCATNRPPYTLQTRQSLDAQADIRAPVIICAEQLYLSFFGGSAASNSVLSGIEIPLAGAP
jgi:hypothetical protein